MKYQTESKPKDDTLNNYKIEKKISGKAPKKGKINNIRNKKRNRL